ncbi:hypothetical protein LP420_09495 [Massilia sp. B-10]|nr:hypothetical protein LP420_09495 [Massilia sp. B-10]
MPLYTLRNSATGVQVQTSDPGVAMVTGKWNDIGKFKTPNLRGAAARALLPRRFGAGHGSGGAVLRPQVQDGTEPAGSGRPGRLPEGAVSAYA